MSFLLIFFYFRTCIYSIDMQKWTISCHRSSVLSGVFFLWNWSNLVFYNLCQDVWLALLGQSLKQYLLTANSWHNFHPYEYNGRSTRTLGLKMSLKRFSSYFLNLHSSTTIMSFITRFDSLLLSLPSTFCFFPFLLKIWSNAGSFGHRVLGRMFWKEPRSMCWKMWPIEKYDETSLGLDAPSHFSRSRLLSLSTALMNISPNKNYFWNFF